MRRKKRDEENAKSGLIVSEAWPDEPDELEQSRGEQCSVVQ